MEGLGMWTAAANGMEVEAVALRGVRMTAQVGAVGQRVVVEQVFVNKERQPIEAVYMFPLPTGAAVCGFEAITGERVLTGEIEELGKGMEQYEEAVKAGHAAFMAELWRPDVFSTRVGNLKPGQAVLIRLTYVVETELHERRMRLEYPTTMAPRYATATGMDPVEAAVENDALNPPHVLAVPYGLELNVTIDVGLAIQSVASPTHGLKIEKLEGHGWRATLAAGIAEMNRAVVIEAELVKEAGAMAWVEEGKDPAERFVGVAFVPEFAVEELDTVTPRDVVFVLDCSGSMEGPSIEQAKRALGLCLRSLNEGDRFNICRFGSTYQWMGSEAGVYGQRTLEAGLAYVEGIRADLGGTEMFAPLEAVLKGAGSLVREVILLTDGQVGNEPALVKMAGGHKGKARVFALGIGPASSAYLVKGVSEATGGAADFIAPGERIEEKVLRMFGRMASPRIEALRVDWGTEAEMEPREVGAVFDGEVVRVAARLRETAPAKVALKGMWKGREKVWDVAVEGRSVEGMIAASWARRRLAALEGDHARREEVVGLSKRYGVLCKETTLVAVEHRSLEERTKGMPATRKVPVMLAQGWGGTEIRASLSMSLRDMGQPLEAYQREFVREPAYEERALREMTRYCIRESTPARDPEREARARREYEERKTEELHQLLMRQEADGAFRWEELLNGTAQRNASWHYQRLLDDAKVLVSGMEKALQGQVVTTATVVDALRSHFRDRESEWRAAHAKAMRWLEKTAPGVKAWLERGAPTIMKDKIAVHYLLNMGSREGYFRWKEGIDRELFARMSWDCGELQKELRPMVDKLQAPLQAQAVATALTLRLLRERFMAREGMWREAWERAMEWLEKVAPAIKEWVEKA